MSRSFQTLSSLLIWYLCVNIIQNASFTFSVRQSPPACKCSFKKCRTLSFAVRRVSGGWTYEFKIPYWTIDRLKTKNIMTYVDFQKQKVDSHTWFESGTLLVTRDRSIPNFGCPSSSLHDNSEYLFVLARSEYWVTTTDANYLFGLVTRDCGWLVRLWLQMWNLCKI